MRLVALTLLLCSLWLGGPRPVHAQEPSLVGGTWKHSENLPDSARPGQVLPLSILAEFTDAGRLTVRHAQPSTETIGYYGYRMTGPSSYATVLTGYAPPQYAPLFPPIGTRGNCNFAFRTEMIVDITCDGIYQGAFTRQ